MDNLYPVMMKMKGKRVVIVGGGQIALRKAKGLEESGADITIISPSIHKEFLQLPYIKWKQKVFEAEDIKEAHLILAATNIKTVNEYVCQCATESQWINDTSNSENSNFITPAVVRREKFVLSVSTSGASPILAKKIKKELEERYDDHIVEMLEDYERRREKR
ncbi:precorrin-2 dehydrogenase/sirohydrochlorin ferrochelatase family protein [Bacillus sp. FSL K6-3431]|uniref:precorrin-2 dehydrogenase/sirohydrochlorin ferrochelatase family protein n=1 Tax=Bacillus sp. FSL K6-3431 TaxID=2921500 RepID=UPI0030FA8829